MARIAKKSGTYHHGDLRRVLLETAVRVIEQEGLSALSLHALTRKAGVSSAAPYHHFASREQLLTAIAQQGFELLAGEMQRAANEAGPSAADQLRALGLGYIRFATTHRGHFRVMFRAELHADLAGPDALPGGGGLTMLREAVLRCQREGVAPPGDPVPLVLVCWTCVHGASNLWIDGSLASEQLVPDREQLAQLIAGTMVDLIRGSAARQG